eukprot:3588363-Amphidinium_carterae.1
MSDSQVVFFRGHNAQAVIQRRQLTPAAQKPRKLGVEHSRKRLRIGHDDGSQPPCPPSTPIF